MTHRPPEFPSPIQRGGCQGCDSTGNNFGLFRPDDAGKLQTLHSVEVFGVVRSLAGLPLLKQRKKCCLRENGESDMFPLSINQEKLLTIANKLGHDIRVFRNSASCATSSNLSTSFYVEADDFYDLTLEDYYTLTSAKPCILKTHKAREAEDAACRVRIPKAIIRVCFPDNYILEATFQSSEKLESLMDLLRNVIAKPDGPFYIYTTPPKKPIRDMLMDFYSAGFAPGANVYFSYELPEGSEYVNTNKMGSYLRDEILSLEGLDYPSKQQVYTAASLENPARQHVYPASYEHSVPCIEIPVALPGHGPVKKMPTKPKWLRL